MGCPKDQNNSRGGRIYEEVSQIRPFRKSGKYQSLR